MKGKPGRKEKGCDSQPIQTAKGTGNKAYTLDRLKRENAELFQAVVAGELSANAAAQAKEASRSAKAAELVRAEGVTHQEAAERVNISRQAVTKALATKTKVTKEKVASTPQPTIKLTKDPTLTAKNILAKMGREPFTL
jgi:hypothetical protein